MYLVYIAPPFNPKRLIFILPKMQNTVQNNLHKKKWFVMQTKLYLSL